MQGALGSSEGSHEFCQKAATVCIVALCLFVLSASHSFAQNNRDAFVKRLQDWQHQYLHEGRHYIEKINNDYYKLKPPFVSRGELLEIRLMRSFWAYELVTYIVETAHQKIADQAQSDSLVWIYRDLHEIRGFVSRTYAQKLIDINNELGDRVSARELAFLLADSAEYDIANTAISTLRNLSDEDKNLVRKHLGAPPLEKIVPQSPTRNYNPYSWLKESIYSDYRFVPGRPDCLFFRNSILCSGDVLLIETNHPGDGIFDSLMEEPGFMPHAMTFVIYDVKQDDGAVLRQPGFVEVYNDGIRIVPLSTVSSRHFTWSAEIARDPTLPSYYATLISEVLDKLRTQDYDFDFKCKPVPAGGDHISLNMKPHIACATLNMMLRARVDELAKEKGLVPKTKARPLPYVATPIAKGAQDNILRLGSEPLKQLITPISLLLQGFERIGSFDNGFPVEALTQTIVVGSPEEEHTFGGMITNFPLNRDERNDTDGKVKPRKIRAFEIVARLFNVNTYLLLGPTLLRFAVAKAQTDSWVGRLTRLVAGAKKTGVPRSNTPSIVVYYLFSDIAARKAVNSVCEAVLVQTDALTELPSVTSLRQDPVIQSTVRQAVHGGRTGRWHDIP